MTLSKTNDFLYCSARMERMPKNQFYPFQNQAVIVAPSGVRIGPLFVAGFFLLISLWAKFLASPLNHPELLYFTTIFMILASLYSSISASLWRIEFSEDSFSIHTLHSKQIIVWNEIASVSERTAPVGRFLVNVVIKLHGGKEITTRSFRFTFAQQLKSEIQRRLELNRR